MHKRNPRWGLRRYQRGIICASGITYGGLSVQIRADGRFNTRLDATCYVGAQFNSNGNEYEYSNTGSTTNAVAWLLVGSASQAYVRWVRTGGTLSDWNNLGSGVNNTPLQLSTTRSYRISRPLQGTNTIIGAFRIEDSGANILAQGPGTTWSAEYDTIGGPCPLCCFTPDTPVLMADGTEKAIQDVVEGDMIAVWDFDNKRLSSEPCSGVIIMTNRPMYRLTFDDGREIRTSEDHPFEVKGVGPASINPDPTVQYKNLPRTPTKLELYHPVQGSDGRPHGIMSIDRINYPWTVYTLDNHNFIANGLVVY